MEHTILSGITHYIFGRERGRWRKMHILATKAKPVIVAHSLVLILITESINAEIGNVLLS
jgi:hypothetical protein